MQYNKKKLKKQEKAYLQPYLSHRQTKRWFVSTLQFTFFRVQNVQHTQARKREKECRKANEQELYEKREGEQNNAGSREKKTFRENCTIFKKTEHFWLLKILFYDWERDKLNDCAGANGQKGFNYWF